MFVLSQEHTRKELLDFVGSKQRQSGIIWGFKEPGCVIVTSGGKNAEQVGYADAPNANGTYSYIGQGQKGDQNPNLFANELLSKRERTILLFISREPSIEEKKAAGSRRKLFKFDGIYEIGFFETIIPSIGPRKDNKLIRYTLVRANNIYNIQSPNEIQNQVEEEVKGLNLEELRRKAITKNANPFKTKSAIREYFIRSVALIKYARERAKGICENCNSPAPFIDSNDLPFLEVHHISRLADDGPDDPQNVAAICPNCHRKAHYGKNKDEFKDELYRIIIAKEDNLFNS